MSIIRDKKPGRTERVDVEKALRPAIPCGYKNLYFAVVSQCREKVMELERQKAEAEREISKGNHPKHSPSYYDTQISRVLDEGKRDVSLLCRLSRDYKGEVRQPSFTVTCELEKGDKGSHDSFHAILRTSDGDVIEGRAARKFVGFGKSTEGKAIAEVLNGDWRVVRAMCDAKEAKLTNGSNKESRRANEVLFDGIVDKDSAIPRVAEGVTMDNVKYIARQVGCIATSVREEGKTGDVVGIRVVSEKDLERGVEQDSLEMDV